MIFEPCYVVTRDLIDYCERRLGLPLSSSQREALRSLEEKVIGVVRENLPPNIKLLSVPSLELRKGVERIVEMIGEVYEVGKVITLDPIYYDKTPWRIEVNRVIDPFGNLLGIAERPGTPPLEEQLDRLDGLRGEEVIVADAGAWSGDTQSKIKKKLEEKEIKVVGVVVGIAPQPVDVVANVRLINPVDYLEGRDLVGISGRVIGVFINGVLRSTSLYTPYWAGDIERWASLSDQVRPRLAALYLEAMEILGDSIEGREELPTPVPLLPYFTRKMFKEVASIVAAESSYEQLLKRVNLKRK